MNTQEIFNKVATHLLTQNAQAGKQLDDHFRCLYRSDDGKLSCAIGCLIADKFYEPYLEGYSVYDQPVLDIVELSVGRKLSAYELQLLMQLQVIHDRMSVVSWRSELQKMAKLAGLEMPL